MPNDKEKDELLTTPLENAPRTTPQRTPPASGETPPDLPDGFLRALRQRYDILTELGRGGMGIVYKGRDRETGDVVALKVLRPEIAADTAVIERFKSELLLARKITHKNVCRVHDLSRFGAAAAISMEYIEGQSLRSVLQSLGGVALRRGLEWLRQICSALAEAHAQGVVHRDLKPENILITKDGNVKVMDFGIARSIEADVTLAGAFIGTPAYMSPEQAEGKPADARSDIYTLGLILYEMFTGHRTFHADTPAAFMHKHVHETPTPPREVERLLPGFLDRAIWKCLEKNPGKRFQSVAELAAAFAEKPEVKSGAAADEEVELPLHLPRWQRSDWLLVVSAIAGLVLFFPFFNRSSLAPRSKVHFDRSVLRRIAQEYAQRFGAPANGDGWIDAPVNGGEYEYLGKAAGARLALELTNNPLLYSRWEVTWDNETQVAVTNSGALQSFTRSFPGDVPEENLSTEDARALADKALRELFDRDPSLLRLEYKATGQIFSGHPASVLRWVEPKDYYGIKRHYEVWLVGRSIGAMSASDEVPAGYDWPYFYRQLLPLFAVLLPMIVLGLIQWRQVDSTAPWRIIFLGVAVALFEWHFWPSLRDLPAANLIVLLLTIAVICHYLLCFSRHRTLGTQNRPGQVPELDPGV